ncbi:GH25 family lysozyme, partial [Allofournierella massiliensis]|uniref:GH25 family lysozyme n=3 Tax=Allofournierella massiliensis TaxID=1650663 RepID=UPI003563D906
MQQGMKKGLAAVLSVVLTASLLLNCFSIGVFAQDDSSALEEQIVAQLQQEGVPADSTGESAETEPENTPVVSAAPTQEPVATAEPQITATPEPTVVPEATATPEPTAAPEATATPEPTATPEATATPEPTATPEATATIVPDRLSRQVTEKELKQQIEDLLEQSYSLTEMTEEELEESLKEIDAIAAVPMEMAEDGQADPELQDMMTQLADAQAAMEDMRMALQAKREGWLDQLPQTGKENSWRYQNGKRIDAQVNTLGLDLPDGVSTFSAGSYWGIDVSHHQGVIDWDAVKAAGVDFAVIRCGYGMNLTEQDDKQWSRNVSECERLGIPYGVYFYSYAMSADMAVDEAVHAVRLLEGHNPDLPVFYDLEENRQLVLGNSGLAEIARIFCDIVGSKGYDVGVYASLNWWNYYLTDAVFENWYRWVAEWRSSCSYNGRYEMWQYTSKGSISGISGNVDMNYWYGPLGANEKNYEAVYNYEYYISHNPDLSGYTREQAFQHFVEHGMAEGRQGNAEFNVYNYRARYADLMDWLGNDLRSYYIHYKDHGKAEGRDAQTYCRLSRYQGQDYSAVYNYDYYVQNNEDIRNLYGYSDYLTIQHFVEHGMGEGRQGSAEFNVYNYRARYADLMDWLGNDLRSYYIHYK